MELSLAARPPAPSAARSGAASATQSTGSPDVAREARTRPTGKQLVPQEKLLEYRNQHLQGAGIGVEKGSPGMVFLRIGFIGSIVYLSWGCCLSGCLVPSLVSFLSPAHNF